MQIFEKIKNVPNQLVKTPSLYGECVQVQVHAHALALAQSHTYLHISNIINKYVLHDRRECRRKEHNRYKN